MDLYLKYRISLTLTILFLIDHICEKRIEWKMILNNPSYGAPNIGIGYLHLAI
jgi:hypothetical protein